MTYTDIKTTYSDWKKYYVCNLEIDSSSEGVTRSYIVVMICTGEKTKYGGDIYEENTKKYFIKVSDNKYTETTNPYKH